MKHSREKLMVLARAHGFHDMFPTPRDIGEISTWIAKQPAQMQGPLRTLAGTLMNFYSIKLAKMEDTKCHTKKSKKR